MRHFSCDLCGKDLTPGTDARFVLRMEVIAATDPSHLSDDDLDSDHVEEMAQLLAEMQADDADPLPDRKQFEYDLCPGCSRKFVRDPLGRDSVFKLQFSKN